MQYLSCPFKITELTEEYLLMCCIALPWNDGSGTDGAQCCAEERGGSIRPLLTAVSH